MAPIVLATFQKDDSIHRYNICNGLSNQLLYHSAEIASAIRQGKRLVEIPNYFIVNGVQDYDANVEPSEGNAVPFEVAFDKDFFLHQVQQTFGIRAKLVPLDWDKEQLECAGMGSFQQADPHVVRQILPFFRPSERFQKFISGITQFFQSRGVDDGICVHHRDGNGWHDHCQRWSAIPDGVYRGERSFIQSLDDRGLSRPPARWVYYCGDHDVPEELPMSNYSVFSRDSLMSNDD